VDGRQIVVWDIQTGVVIKDFGADTEYIEDFTFCGNQTIVVSRTVHEAIRVYDVLKGVQLSEVLLPSGAYNMRTHWGHGGSLLATSYKIDGRITINTQELQPASSPPFLVTESFLLQSHDGKFSFSPVSFHASFLTAWEVVILNVRDSKILLRTEKTDRKYCEWSGRFSPDGCFFAYRTSADEIHVWKNTSTGYVPWSNFVSEFPGLKGFAFSPSAISILSWGDHGIELLDNHLRSPSPRNTMHHRRTEAHLVACSADGTRIATARSRKSVVTILDPLLDTPQRYINTNMRILDIKICDNVLFVVDKHELASWDLGVGGTGYDAHGVRRETLDLVSQIERLKLSNDCSRIAVITEWMISLYDIKTQEILNGCKVDQLLCYSSTTNIQDMWFSPDGRQLWFFLGRSAYKDTKYAMVNTTEDWRYAEVEDGWSRDSLFSPPGYRIPIGSGWVEGSGGRKLLWLPPSWRTEYMIDAIWDGNFLALVNGRHPEPMIIEFRPQPLLPHSCSTHSSNP